MTTSRRRSLVLLACLPALIAGIGCGDDDDSSDARTPMPAATQPTSTAAPATAPAAPTRGASKLTAAQKAALLSANNDIALEEDSADFSATGPLYAANYRAVAKPLADGPCKTALERAAAAWTALGKADAAEDAAERQRIGGKMPGLSGDVDRACV